jgi:hypothetical protein
MWWIWEKFLVNTVFQIKYSLEWYQKFPLKVYMQNNLYGLCLWSYSVLWTQDMNVLYDKLKGTPYCPGEIYTNCKAKQTAVRHKAVELETCSSQVLYMTGLHTVLQFVIFFIRARSICPRCTTAYSLIVLILTSYFCRQVPPHPYDARDPSSESWNCGRECWLVIFA